MSFETLIWVRTQKTGNLLARSVLRVLADHAGQDHSCYLRTRTISAETEASEGGVRKALASLIEQGFIRVFERYDQSGARKSNRYQILIDGAETPPPDAEDWAGVREAAPADGGGQAEDGGGTRSQDEGFPIKEASSSEATISKGGASRPKTATRIPEDFQPDEKMRAWFADENLATVIDGKLEHAKFVDYWLATSGARGRKLDWPATWRNWMRTAAERSRYGRPGNSMVPLGTTTDGYRPSTGDQRVAQAQILFDKYSQMEKERTS